MTQEQKIERLEKTVGTLITWLRRELGDQAVLSLLKMLNKDADETE